MAGEILDNLLKNGQYSVEYVADYLSVSKGTVYNWIKKDSIESKYLEQLSKLYNLPITVFFSNTEAPNTIINGDGNLTAGRDLKNSGGGTKKNRECEECEKRLADKERIIAEKDEHITTLRQMVDMLRKGQ